ncbi:hypothetical protein ACFQLX_21745 [Streptomyces polyrhachis]|uniref:Uncharacterized protein n=1 Tax=Streptomyces polyrhachis TaxID=1282885 RepID=A0ABW2GJI1_9ACTN
MSVLCELLLRETVAGRVSAGPDAAPRDEVAATLSPLHSAA